MANYSLSINPIPAVENGHTFRGDNFLQMLPHTKILVGVTGLKFFKCNLTNCDIPADAETDSCRPKHCEFCSNLHPKLVAKGLPECPENCKHVDNIDEIIIDGIIVDKIYHYSDKVVE